jgi:hypothetical protein
MIAERLAVVDHRIACTVTIFGGLPWSVLDIDPGDFDWEQAKAWPGNLLGLDHLHRYGSLTMPNRWHLQIVSDGDNEFPTTGKHDLVAAFESSVRFWCGNSRFSYEYDPEATSHNFGTWATARALAFVGEHS